MVDTNQFVKSKRRRDQYDVYIGRPGFWGNPVVLASEGERDACIVAYWEWLTTTSEGKARLDRVSELAGKTLGCWCAPRLCHGHVLARLANDPDGQAYCEKQIAAIKERMK